ncbi:hypothetical protein [Petrimonas sp.]|uniref:hypothetical protein n=1 Tax=Petrimonas sp. TaxID=2023866 RepID=UPI003F513E16
MKKVTSITLLILFVMISGNCDKKHTKEDEKDNQHIPYPLYGITVDDSWYGQEKLTQIVDAIEAMPVKPTVRIVMNNKIAPKDYIPTFKAIHRVAYVLAQPVDSYYMKGYATVEDYRKRFQDSYEYLAGYVDMWEVANEINGEGWLGGDRQFNADKMYAAYKFIRGKGGKTVVVSYEIEPFGQEMSMQDWLQKYVPDDMKKNLDYLMVSYYEDDNNGYQPNWKNVFENLQKMFPNSKLAIGECGNTAKTATTESKVKMARHYYSMPKITDHYVGGYFWWTWVQDCVPHQDNVVWEEINTHMKNMKY